MRAATMLFRGPGSGRGRGWGRGWRRGERGSGVLARGGERVGDGEVGSDHLLEHEVVVEVEDGARLGGDHRVATEGELVILLLLAGQGPVGGALHGVHAVHDDDLQVRDGVAYRAG